MIRVLMVDDRQLVRESVSRVLEEQHDIAVVATASDVSSALVMVEDMTPDVIVLSMRMSESMQLVQQVTSTFEKTRIVALGTGDEPGVTVLPDCSIDDLVTAIHQADHTRAGGPQAIAPLRLEGSRLTPREQEVACLIDQGFTNKEIARELNISVATAKSHVHRILGKLQVNDRGAVGGAVRRSTA